MGEVYRAHDPKLGRDISLKVLGELRPPTSIAGAASSAEARATTQVLHVVMRDLDPGR
jgi:hypothetical protein